MRKIFIALSILLFVFFFLNRLSVYSEGDSTSASDTVSGTDLSPTPTPADGELGGKCRSGHTANAYTVIQSIFSDNSTELSTMSDEQIKNLIKDKGICDGDLTKFLPLGINNYQDCIDFYLKKIKEEQKKTTTDEWGCVDIFFIQAFCVSSVFESAEESVRALFDDAFNDSKTDSICDLGLRPSNIEDLESCICEKEEGKESSNILCQRYIAQGDNQESNNCSQCFEKKGYWSAIGCIYVNSWKDFFEKNIFGLLIGLAGFVALLCIIYSAFILQTSQGNPEKTKKAQELLTSCITGLMLIIFSIFILRLIGVSILGIPGFS